MTHASFLRSFPRHLFLAVLTVPMSLVASAQTGHSVMFIDGWNAYEAGDYREAVAIWTTLAEQGHVNAQVNLGFMYDHGTGVAQDHQAAAHWYRAAALQNSPVGQYNLSLLITEGNTAPLAGRSAYYWMEKAAAQGFADARQAMGEKNGRDGAIAEVQTSITPGHSATSQLNTDRPNTSSIDVPVSIGTAWPVADGYAVTSHHIIDSKQRIRLINTAGQEFTAEVIAVDAALDIALLGIGEPGRLPPALPLSPQGASLGASVFTIGFPHIDVMGKSPKLSNGIVSATRGLRDDPDSYQISVPIRQGNSGGPLLNMRGEVVGIVTTMLGERRPDGSPPRPIPNVAYALKTDAIRQLLAKVGLGPVGIGELRPVAGNLEELASRIKDSILTVMAE